MNRRPSTGNNWADAAVTIVLILAMVFVCTGGPSTWFR